MDVHVEECDLLIGHLLLSLVLFRSKLTVGLKKLGCDGERKSPIILGPRPCAPSDFEFGDARLVAIEFDFPQPVLENHRRPAREVKM